MYTTLVGLNVIDDQMYADYRTEMKKILEKYEGSFGFDFRVSEVMKSKVDHPINRVFTLEFVSAEKKISFFTDPGYLNVKNTYFIKSVTDTAIIAEF
jgi:uncharacterized protein (DUF1330 family)